MDSLRTATATTNSTIRPFTSRHPRLVLLAVATLGVGLGVKYQASSIQKNERLQRASTGNHYVAVDRSGGGI
ncbi:unnamed protein product [Discula destructiva]